MIDIKFMIDIVYDILIKMTLWVLIGSIPIVFMALIVVIVKKTNFGIKTRKVITIIYQIQLFHVIMLLLQLDINQEMNLLKNYLKNMM